MHDHRLGFPALAAFIADQHEPERKPMRTPAPVRRSAEQQRLDRCTDAAHQAIPAYLEEKRRAPELPAPRYCTVKVSPQIQQDGRLTLTKLRAATKILDANRDPAKTFVNLDGSPAAKALEKTMQNGVELIAGHVYRLRHAGGGSAFSKWDGKQWCEVDGNPETARTIVHNSYTMYGPDIKLVRDVDAAPPQVASEPSAWSDWIAWCGVDVAPPQVASEPSAWIAWCGVGALWVQGDYEFQVKYREIEHDEDRWYTASQVGFFDWAQRDLPADIVSYRVRRAA